MSGIFGVSTNKNCAEILLYGTDYHSHLGTEYGGIAVYGKGRITCRVRNIASSQFKTVLENDIADICGNKGLGVVSADSKQPVYLNSKFGEFALCVNGRVNNLAEIVRSLYAKGVSFSQGNASAFNLAEVVAKIISLEDDVVSGIAQVFREIVGSCSIILVNNEGVYAGRDAYGNSPLVLGKRGNEYVVTSETTALPNLGFTVCRDLIPGEIVLLNEQGITVEQLGIRNNSAICSFLWIYTGFPTSNYEGINTEVVRERSGAFLAKRNQVDADMVAGVPDSGTAHAIGYAMESGIKFRRPLVKYTPGYGRSYTPPSQADRNHIATMKLIPNKDIINGKRIVLCDDSIVRGTQLKNFTVAKLLNNGAQEVHVRIACPPLLFPCLFNISTRSITELAARRAIKAIEGRTEYELDEYLDESSEKYKAMVSWIQNDMGVTSLHYQRLEDLIKAIGLPGDSLCTYCWTGMSKCCQNGLTENFCKKSSCAVEEVVGS